MAEFCRVWIGLKELYGNRTFLPEYVTFSVTFHFQFNIFFLPFSFLPCIKKKIPPFLQKVLEQSLFWEILVHLQDVCGFCVVLIIVHSCGICDGNPVLWIAFIIIIILWLKLRPLLCPNPFIRFPLYFHTSKQTIFKIPSLIPSFCTTEDFRLCLFIWVSVASLLPMDQCLVDSWSLEYHALTLCPSCLEQHRCAVRMQRLAPPTLSRLGDKLLGALWKGINELHLWSLQYIPKLCEANLFIFATGIAMKALSVLRNTRFLEIQLSKFKKSLSL